MDRASDTIGFEIKRIGQQPETVWADSCTEEGPPPSRYLFRKNGEIVFELYAYAAESEPKPIYRSHENQLNLQKEGRCMICGGVAVSRHFCLNHRIKKDAIRVHKRRYGDQKPTNGKWIKLAAVVLTK